MQFESKILLRSAFFVVQLSQDHWKYNSFDYTALCRQNDVYAF